MYKLYRCKIIVLPVFALCLFSNSRTILSKTVTINNKDQSSQSNASNKKSDPQDTRENIKTNKNLAHDHNSVIFLNKKRNGKIDLSSQIVHNEKKLFEYQDTAKNIKIPSDKKESGISNRIIDGKKRQISHNTRNAVQAKVPNVTFVKWPHRRIFFQDLGFGNWFAGKQFGIDFSDVYKKSDKLSRIQSAAIEEGYFVPTRFQKIHLYSSEETRSCIRGKTILFTGDSYMKQMFIGMIDIILNDPNNVEIHGGAIREAVMIERITKLHVLIKSLPSADRFNLLWEFDHCVHSDIQCLVSALEQSRLASQADAVVANVLVHHMTVHMNDTTHDGIADSYLTQLLKFFDHTSIRLTWCLGPKYDLMKVPDKYQKVTRDRPTDLANKRLAEMTLSYTKIPILDMNTMTGRCLWSNCSSDGGHRSRFVNRMKVQMFLNNLCELHQ